MPVSSHIPSFRGEDIIASDHDLIVVERDLLARSPRWTAGQDISSLHTLSKLSVDTVDSAD